MEHKLMNNIFQIKQSSSSEKEKENVYPSRYIKDKYPHLNKVVPKNSILFKVKYKPDIIINQYNQISNNINTNLKMKPSPSLVSNNRYNNQQNFYPQNKYYSEFTNNTLLNYLDENDFNVNYYNIIDTIDKNYEENLLKNNELIFGENEIMSPKFISDNNRESALNLKRKNKLKEESNENNFDNLNNIIFNSPKYTIKENLDINYLYENHKNNNNIDLYSNNMHNINKIEPKSKYNYEYNITETNTAKNMFIDDLINSKTRQQLYKYFSPRQIVGKIMKTKKKNKIKSSYTKDYFSIDKNTNDILSKKLNYYRIKLFKEFFKHFKIFYRIRLSKYFICFLDKIKNFKKSYKIIFKKNNNSIREYKSRKVFILPNTDISEELFDTNINSKNLILKNKDNQKNETEQHKKKLKKTINSNNKANIKNKDKNVSTLSNKNNIIKSVPRMTVKLNNYNNNFSVERKKNNELYQINSYSPSFQFGNKKIIIRDLSFKAEGNNNENELYRNSRELSKKYKQIQLRRICSKHKNNHNTNNSISINSENIPLKTDINSQFAKIKNYMKSIKDRNEYNRVQENSNINNTFNNYANKVKNNKNLLRIRKSYFKNSKDINVIQNNKSSDNNRLIKNNTGSISFNLIKIKNNQNNIKHQNKSMNSSKNKKIKALILNNTNYKNIDYNHIFSSPKNNIYYSSYNKNCNKKTKNKNKVYNVFSTLIKNISTKDRRINIYINYYYLLYKKKSKKTKFDNLMICNNFGINYNINNNIKLRLSEIKEE